MKKEIMILLSFTLLLLSFQPANVNNASVQVPLQKVAVIIDSQEFYHSSYVDDILDGFSAINTTFLIDYDVFHLTNYSLVSTNPYLVSYTYNDTVTNHTQLIQDLIVINEYDLFVIIGYELRRGFIDIAQLSENNFLFYDLSGEYPAFNTAEIPSNLFIISFQDHEEAFLAGSLAVEKFLPLPQKIAVVGTYKGDPRSRRLIAGFQSAVFRHSTNVDIKIFYVDSFVDRVKVQSIGYDLNNQGYGLVFSALQANNTLELINSFTGGPMVSVDLNLTPSVMKNNSYVIYDVFSSFNESGGFSGGVVATYGLSDNVFVANGWNDPSMVNKTIIELIDEVTSKGLVIPSEIVYASNTPGFSFLIMIFSITGLIIIRKKTTKGR